MTLDCLCKDLTPFTLFYDDFSSSSHLFYGVGLLDKNIEVTFPVCKDVALFASWREGVKKGYVEADNKIVREATWRTVWAALKYVFASKRLDALNRMVQKAKDTAPVIKTR